MMNGLDFLLISNPTNIYYLTGFVGAAPSEREAYVIAAPKSLWLFVSPLYLEQARKIVHSLQLAVHGKKINIEEISRDNPLSQRIKEMFNTSSTIKLGFEESDLTVAEFTNLKNKITNVQWVPIQNRIENLRIIKTPNEIAAHKKAAALTDACFDFIVKILKHHAYRQAGVQDDEKEISETEIAWEIESFFKRNNASNAFSPIVALGKNSSMPHYAPSANCKLSTANLVLLDFGAKVDGYCADMTRIIFLGNPTNEQKNAYNSVLEANQNTIKLLQNGQRSGAKLDQISRKLIQTRGFDPYPHSLGHGVGLAIHENPRLSFRQDFILKLNMVFTIEPGVYIEGKFGIRIEDLVYLNENNSIEVLTKSTKELLII